MAAERPRLRDALAALGVGQGGRARGGHAGATTRSSSSSPSSSRACSAQTGYGTLAALISAFLILLVAGQSVQLAAAREAALDRLGHPEVAARDAARVDAAAARRARGGDGGLGAAARAARRR